MNFKIVTLIGLMLIVMCGCTKAGENKMNVDLSELKQIPQEKWDKLAQKKIYFGHQSVGYDIIDGVNDLVPDVLDIPLAVMETKNAGDFENPIFAHSGVGTNSRPFFKCDEFKDNLNQGIGKQIDFAILKFCWADFKRDTDVNKVFNYYVKTMVSLETVYPEAKFIYVTTPLMVPQSPYSLKGIAKVILRKKYLGQELENLKRDEFNNKLREYCESSNRTLFDLEKIETTYPNGDRYVYKRSSLELPALIPEYTDDGGHPNELSRKIIAKELFKLLVSNF